MILKEMLFSNIPCVQKEIEIGLVFYNRTGGRIHRVRVTMRLCPARPPNAVLHSRAWAGPSSAVVAPPLPALNLRHNKTYDPGDKVCVSFGICYKHVTLQIRVA